jgi:hypothetical protein
VEEVDCSECGNRYDSDTQAFCPRCGSVGSNKVAGIVAAVRFEPGRRRAQVGGLVLIVTAATMLVLYGMVLATAGTLVADQSLALLQDQPGGELEIWVDGYVPADGSGTFAVATRAGFGLANGTLDASGGAHVPELSSASVNVTITTHNGTWNREVLVLRGDTQNVTVIPGVSATSGQLGTDALAGPVRIMVAFFMLVSLFVVLGGVSAVRLRNKNVAIGAAIVGIMPILILAVAVPNIGTMLLLLVMALALGFIVAGRSHFR